MFPIIPGNIVRNLARGARGPARKLGRAALGRYGGAIAGATIGGIGGAMGGMLSPNDSVIGNALQWGAMGAGVGLGGAIGLGGIRRGQRMGRLAMGLGKPPAMMDTLRFIGIGMKQQAKREAVRFRRQGMAAARFIGNTSKRAYNGWRVL